MRVEFVFPAEDELKDAIDNYNSQSEGLGFEFAIEVARTLRRIQQYPDACPKLSDRTRRCRTNRFPYGLAYQAGEDTVFIMAVMHLSRNPKTWKSRLGSREA